jgi:hypothetical protein
MGEFLKFWWDCLIKGFRVADGFFAFVEGFCLFIGAGLRSHNKIPFLKKYTEKWNVWEGVVMKWAFAICLISFMVSTLFVAPFLTYKGKDRDYNAIKQSIKQLESENESLIQKTNELSRELDTETRIAKSNGQELPLSPEALDRIRAKVNTSRISQTVDIRYDFTDDKCKNLANQIAAVLKESGKSASLNPQLKMQEGISVIVMKTNIDFYLQIFRELNKQPAIQDDSDSCITTINIGKF